MPQIGKVAREMMYLRHSAAGFVPHRPASDAQYLLVDKRLLYCRSSLVRTSHDHRTRSQEADSDSQSLAQHSAQVYHILL
jgi:hypothetical protein